MLAIVYRALPLAALKHIDKWMLGFGTFPEIVYRALPLAALKLCHGSDTYLFVYNCIQGIAACGIETRHEEDH